MCALLVGGCYSTYTTVDGERCRRYEPLCGLLADDELRCELDDRGCQVCTCQRARSPAGLERNEHDRDAYDPWKR